ncbi:MAG: lipopolysaccharide kinase InaA family protein [Candidatus Bathyarchaeia archaeon]
MSGQTRRMDKEITESLMRFCRYVAGSCDITALCIIGDSESAFKAKTASQVLLVIRDFKQRLMTYLDVFENKSFIIFAVDQWVFERDVDRGFLGEALAGGLIFPYIPIVGENYLRVQEVQLKKRLIHEILENIVLDFPELSYNIYIKPEYFMYEALLTRARLFPLMLPDLIEFMREDRKNANVNCVLPGYLLALEELEMDGVITFSGGFVKVSSGFIDGVKSRKIRFVSLFRSAQKALFNSLIGTFPKIFSFLMQNRDLLTRFRFVESYSRDVCFVEDPQAYLFVPTANGLVSLANRLDLKAFAKKVLAADKKAEVKVAQIGSVLNETYLIMASANGMEKKIVAKRFKDWSSFKWFPLTLWTVGTRTFAVLGRSRLERECAINQFLHSHGFAVPKLLHVNHCERLVLMEYIEGESLEKKIKRIAEAKTADEVKNEFDIIRKVGEKFAEVHALDVALGDTKPENIIVGKDNQIYLLDFEQASRNGDRTWDIAEFLYYAGHYFSPFSKSVLAEHLAKAFIEGYLEAGGEPETVKKAGNPKYTKVFSVFTLPHIMLIILNTCKRADKVREKRG